MVTLTPEAERNRELSRERMRRMRERKRGSVTQDVTPAPVTHPVTQSVTQSVTHPSVDLSDILGGPDLPDHRIFMEVRSLFPLAPITREEAQSFVDCVVVSGYYPIRTAAQSLRNAGQMPAFSDWIAQEEVRCVS